jgi:hypothetical protein
LIENKRSILQSVTACCPVPPPRCDNRNLGINKICTLTDPDLPNPTIFGESMLLEYTSGEDGDPKLPEYVADSGFGSNIS